MDLMESRTDPRVLRTRQLIKDAFVQLLQDVDLQRISVNRITELATINRVTFYLHYRDIPDMLEKLAEEMLVDIRTIVDREPMKTGYCRSEVDLSVISDLFEHIGSHADFYKLVLATKQIPIFTERLLGFLTELITTYVENIEYDAHLPTSRIPTDITVWYFSSALIGTMIAWLQNDMPYTPVFLAKQFSLLINK